MPPDVMGRYNHSMTPSRSGGLRDPGRGTRDAERSREAILVAAEAVFAERGYEGAGLSAIAARAGLARATPTYFFGSKRALYEAVLERATTAREKALRDAFSPVSAWASDGEAGSSLRDALRAAVAGYIAFLDRNPRFAKLIAWEAQSGGHSLHYAGAHATAVTDALRALHAVRRERGLADFDPSLVSVALVSMCFLPVAHRTTFQASGGLDSSDSRFRRDYGQVVTNAIHALVTGRPSC
jgi:AcrR family transcriptional regulator